MPFTPVEAVFGGAALAFAIYWHGRLVPVPVDGPPSLRATLSAHAPSVAFTAGVISVGIVLSHVMPGLFYPLPLTRVPLGRLVIAAGMASAGATLANACRVPHLCPFTSPLRMGIPIIALLTAIITATLLASSRFFISQTVIMKKEEGGISRLALLATALLTAAVAPPLLARACSPPLPSLLQETLGYALGAGTALAIIAANVLHPSKLLSALDIEAEFWDPSLPLTIFSVVVLLYVLPTPPSSCSPLSLSSLSWTARSYALLLLDGDVVVNDEFVDTITPPLKLPDAFDVLHPHTDTCPRGVVGALLFGAGCGLGGIPPHCALIYFGAFPSNIHSVAVVVTMLATTAICSIAIAAYDEPLQEDIV